MFKSHPLASDITGSHHLHNTTCNNCSLEAAAKFEPLAKSNLGWEGGCG